MQGLVGAEASNTKIQAPKLNFGHSNPQLQASCYCSLSRELAVPTIVGLEKSRELTIRTVFELEKSRKTAVLTVVELDKI